jgi:hypothetical protein
MQFFDLGGRLRRRSRGPWSWPEGCAADRAIKQNAPALRKAVSAAFVLELKVRLTTRRGTRAAAIAATVAASADAGKLVMMVGASAAS